MNKFLITIFVSLIFCSVSNSEEKDNSHLENKFETYFIFILI